MKRKIVSLATGLAVAMGVSSAVADPNFSGSDTLLDFVRLLLADCAALGSPAQQAACAALVYSGGGSTAGQTDLIATYATPTTNQVIAPMSRELNSAACGTKQATAKGWVLSLDALSLVSSTAAGEVCDPPPVDEDPVTPGNQEFGANLRRSGTLTLLDLGRNTDGRPVNIAGNAGTGTQVPAGGAFLYPRAADGIVCKGCGAVAAGLPTDTNDTSYTFQDITVGTTVVPGTAWQDVLRILYTGATHTMGNTRVGIASGTGANLANTTAISSFCGGDLRRTLVSQWQNIIEGCASEGACVGGVKRLLRRGDASGTTDTFLALLNLPSIRNNPGSTQSGALPFGSPLSGIPVPGSPFCNGNDQRDNDPIRIPCSTTTNAGQAVDMVCNRYVVDNNATAGDSKDDEIINSVGLLVPVFVPEELTPFATVPAPGMAPSLPLGLPDISAVHASANSGTQKYENYRKFPRPICSTSTALGRAPTDPDTGLQVAICPDGTPALGGTCQVLATSGSNGAYPSCLNVNRATTAPNVATVFGGNTCGPAKNLTCVPFRAEGRVYNTTVFNPPPAVPAPANYGNTTTGVRVAQYSRVIAGSAAQPFRDVNAAFYRIRQTVRPTAPATIAADTCTFDSSTEDIGCIAGNYGAAECALGFAGGEATALANTVGMKVNAIQPTPAQVRAQAYPLSRKLFINTLDNVDAGQPDQFQAALNPFQTNLATFMNYLDGNPATVNTRADQLGFISVPLGAGGLECVDFRADQLNPGLPAGSSGNTCPTSDTLDACN